MPSKFVRSVGCSSASVEASMNVWPSLGFSLAFVKSRPHERKMFTAFGASVIAAPISSRRGERSRICVRQYESASHGGRLLKGQPLRRPYCDSVARSSESYRRAKSCNPGTGDKHIELVLLSVVHAVHLAHLEASQIDAW